MHKEYVARVPFSLDTGRIPKSPNRVGTFKTILRMSNPSAQEKKLKADKLGSYSGNMTVIVANQSGGTITEVSVTHVWTNGNGVPDTFSKPSMGSNENDSFPIRVGSGGDDLWSVRWVDSNGQCWYRNQKQCDVYEEDLRSGNPIHVNLINGDNGFSVEMPESSSCDDNYVNNC